MDLYKVIFENDNLLIIGKKQGISVQPDDSGEKSLIELIKEEFGEKCNLCHRLDRNTGGIVLIAKNDDTLSKIEKAIEENRIQKSYKAVLCGEFSKSQTYKESLKQGIKEQAFKRLTYFHFKDAKKSMVLISNQPKKLYKKIITDYRILAYDSRSNTTLIEVRLVTGRTHQIRAQFAYLGYPVAGDGKYGRNADNKKLAYKYQALWAYKVDFGGLFKNEGVPDVFEYQPEFSLKTSH